MQTFMELCGFAGAWLLVAGPIHQAAVELRDEDLERDHIEAVRGSVQKQHTSPWWWLLPPVMIYLSRKRENIFRHEFVKALPDEDAEALLSFMNKAFGWVLVAGGGFLLAIQETYQLVHELDWNIAWFWVLIIGMAGVSLGYTVQRIRRSEQMFGKGHQN